MTLARLVVPLLCCSALFAQSREAGQKAFEDRCARCHGADGNGGEMGPAIPERLARYDNASLIELIHKGLPQSGMPGNPVTGAELTSLVRYVRVLQKQAPKEMVRRTVNTSDGKTLDGELLGEGFNDLQLRTADQKIHLLRRAGDRYREVTSQSDWPTYNGETGGNRFTTLTQINKKNVNRLAPQWVFAIPGAERLEGTPVVVGGLMYVTAANECYALDAGTGRAVWHFKAARVPGMSNDPGINRGVGVAGDRLFIETANAHIVALNRFTGAQLWDSEIADWHQNYFASSAPLPAGDLVITGVGGGEHGANGLVVAFDQATGKQAWRFSTVPRQGEPGSETWKGRDPIHGGAPTWFTGSYDPELDIVYWPTGNPAEEYNGDLRARRQPLLRLHAGV